MRDSPFSPRPDATRLTRAWVPALAVVWIGTQCFDAPLRHVLVLVGAPWLLYIRDALLVLGMGVLCVENGVSRSLLLGGVCLGWAALVAVGQSRDLTQVLFGLKTYLPFLFGAALGATLPPATPGRRARWLARAIFAAAVAGVIANLWLEWPWEGLSYRLGDQGQEIVGARTWTTRGIKRISGFSRASFEAAIAVASLSLVLVAGRRLGVPALATLAIALATVFLTTTKGILVALALVLVDLAARSLGPAAGRVAVHSALTWTLGALVAFLPLISWSGGMLLDTSTDLQDLLLQSMNDRLESCWPAAWKLIVEDGSPWTGRGLGGIGTAQLYFEAELYNPADNLLLYLVGNFGALGALLLVALCARVARLGRSPQPLDQVLGLAGIVILAYGMTTNVVESPLLSLWLGLIASRAGAGAGAGGPIPGPRGFRERRSSRGPAIAAAAT
jgi:hypothetical protein